MHDAPAVPCQATQVSVPAANAVPDLAVGSVLADNAVLGSVSASVSVLADNAVLGPVSDSVPVLADKQCSVQQQLQCRLLMQCLFML